jgi:hypothetical protein
LCHNIIGASLGQNQKTLDQVDYELYCNSTHVCINCTILYQSSTTECVAVVHQRISQLSSSGLMDITSFKLSKSESDGTAYGCIDGVNLTHYQIGAVGIYFSETGQERTSGMLIDSHGIIPACLAVFPPAYVKQGGPPGLTPS